MGVVTTSAAAIGAVGPGCVRGGRARLRPSGLAEEREVESRRGAARRVNGGYYFRWIRFMRAVRTRSPESSRYSVSVTRKVIVAELVSLV